MEMDIESIKMHYFNTQTKKGDKGLHFQKVEKNCRWRHHQKISKRNVKQVVPPLVGHPRGQLGCQKKQKF